ncbi:MAG: 2-oxoacid:acceptor oxidoreductase subunit alpha [Halobacteriovoraceae bacterium]|nr:2-oxoacid:acceptor oxidoreductase subunit alpha [Halobacteriovoraceae bacterium]
MKTQETLESVVIRFCGDSGDGMQLTGTQFSNTSAIMGNDISTFPDFPSEIRAPQGTIAGVSGFQVHIGSSDTNTPGDESDMLVAMNPAALKSNLNSLKLGGAIILNSDEFNEANLAKAGYTVDPLKDHTLDSYKVIKAPIGTLTLSALEEVDLSKKEKERCKNFYTLGMTYYYYNRKTDQTLKWIEDKFGKKPEIMKANQLALKAGYNYAETTEEIVISYSVPSAKIEPGTYRQMSGNVSTAWGLMQAAESANLPLFLGSYPITPATDILHELSKFKHMNVTTFQAEDEIAGICSAIGASIAGSLAVTTSSGPGIALKTEAIGLAIMYETPLIIINVQRGGPSTGLPTKTEQSDLNQALIGRNGEAPLIVLAASRPNDCYEMAYEAARLTLEHMTPVMLLTDGYIANGSEPWKIPKSTDFEKINHRKPSESDLKTDITFMTRNEHSLARTWITPGMDGKVHRMGGLEKDFVTGNISAEPINHQKMCELRAQKVQKVADNIPLQVVEGEATGDLLVVSWGGTYGATRMAVRQLQKDGRSVSLMHLKYLNPMPKNVSDILAGFKKIIVPELNLGQLAPILRSRYGVKTIQYNKVQGQPFKIEELVNRFKEEL